MSEKESVLSDFDVGNKDYKPPSVEELLAALENIPLPEKEKEELRKSILSGELAQKAESIAGAAAHKVVASSSGEFVVLFLLISLVFLVLVFFGYKLYSSLKEKERKREEKKKLKQQKKKK